jgi:nucleoside-diphosphate-sugar epimerase
MAYGMGLGRPVAEDSAFKPFPEPYAITKAAGDSVVQRLIRYESLPAVIIRPATFFGPGDRSHFARTADRLRAGRGIVVGSGANALPFVYVTDVVNGLILAAEARGAIGEAYNIANDQPLTQEQFLHAVAAEVRCPPPRLHVPFRLLYTAGFAAENTWRVAGRLKPFANRAPPLTRLDVCVVGSDTRHSIDKARRDLGYHPQVSIREGVRRAGYWYCQQPLDEVIAADGTEKVIAFRS